MGDALAKNDCKHGTVETTRIHIPRNWKDNSTVNSTY